METVCAFQRTIRLGMIAVLPPYLQGWAVRWKMELCYAVHSFHGSFLCRVVSWV